MARIIRKGVDWVLHGFKPEPDDVDGQIAVGLVSLAEGILLVRQSDTAVLTESYFVYDALYAHLRADALVASQQLELPSLKGGPGARVRFLREVWNSDRSAANAGAPSTR